MAVVAATGALAVAEGVNLPPDFVAARCGIVGMSGAGKSNALRVMIEAVYDIGAPFVLADPLGASWGLRSSADGLGEGLRVPIFGGYHGDLPLSPGAGPLVARELYHADASAVLDLSALAPDDACRFIADFNETLFALHLRKKKLRAYFADECAILAPEKATSDADYRAANTFARLHQGGRAVGIGLKTATQSSADQSKRTMKQAEIFVALRTMAPLDQKPIVEYLRTSTEKAQAEEVRRTLSQLGDGEAWFIAPRWIGEVKRARFHLSRTFDSSYTPKVGEIAVEPKVLAPVDLARIRAAIEREEAPGAKARDVSPVDSGEVIRLRARVAELEARPPERIEVPVLVRADVDAFADAAGKVAEIADRIIGTLNAAAPTVNANAVPRVTQEAAVVVSERVVRPEPALPAERSPARSSAAGKPMGKAERSILTVLAQNNGPVSLTRIAVLTGYALEGGGFKNALGALRSAGHIVRGDPTQVTAEGLAALGSFDPLPTGAALREYWLNRLGKAERAALQAAIDSYPRALSKEQAARKAGYEPDGGGFKNALGRLRTLQLVEGRGEIRASDSLFE